MYEQTPFVSVSNNDIPHHHYNFASYNELQDKTKPLKMLVGWFSGFNVMAI
ncbi:hypothetical protein HanPI659440_Chr17g0702031 [Helianthus annuus]|nr:hypothetical protein HanPI659440_Chr17g0702031 [Helianthus annuus]